MALYTCMSSSCVSRCVSEGGGFSARTSLACQDFIFSVRWVIEGHSDSGVGAREAQEISPRHMWDGFGIQPHTVAVPRIFYLE